MVRETRYLSNLLQDSLKLDQGRSISRFKFILVWLSGAVVNPVLLIIIFTNPDPTKTFA